MTGKISALAMWLLVLAMLAVLICTLAFPGFSRIVHSYAWVLTFLIGWLGHMLWAKHIRRRNARRQLDAGGEQIERLQALLREWKARG